MGDKEIFTSGKFIVWFIDLIAVLLQNFRWNEFLLFIC